MRRVIRSVASVLAIFAALAGVGLAVGAHVWAAGEREVTIAQGIDAEFLDVQMTNNVATIIINGSIYDTLLTRDKQLQIVPHLATSYKLVSDKVWEAKLRQGVKFHNGEAFDATAVKFSAGRDKKIQIWDAKDGKNAGEIGGFDDDIFKLVVSGKSIFSAAVEPAAPVTIVIKSCVRPLGMLLVGDRGNP